MNIFLLFDRFISSFMDNHFLLLAIILGLISLLPVLLIQDEKQRHRWGFTNRGVLFGPYCPVYGFGALLFLVTVYPMIRNRGRREKCLLIPVVFILCMLIATALELFTSYFLEYVIGSWPWQTYRDYRYNFQGRIALSPSFRFGLGGILFLYLLQPLFEQLCEYLVVLHIKRIAIAILIVFLIDSIYTFLLV